MSKAPVLLVNGNVVTRIEMRVHVVVTIDENRKNHNNNTTPQNKKKKNDEKLALANL